MLVGLSSFSFSKPGFAQKIKTTFNYEVLLSMSCAEFVQTINPIGLEDLISALQTR